MRQISERHAGARVAHSPGSIREYHASGYAHAMLSHVQRFGRGWYEFHAALVDGSNEVDMRAEEECDCYGRLASITIERNSTDR